MGGINPETTTQNGVTVVRLGDGCDAIDEGNVEEVNAFLLELAQSADPPTIVIDLSRITFFASSFIEVLFRVWNRLNRRQGHFALCGLTQYCGEVIHVSRLDTLWDLYPDAASAVSALEA
jgi:anti-anti-sigma factor